MEKKESAAKKYASLIRKYQIPMTGFYWRKKKAGDDEEKLIEYLEEYKAMAERRAERKKQKAEAVKRQMYKTNNSTPIQLMSKDEYYLFLYDYIKKSVYVIKPKYPSAVYNKLENEDIIQDIFYQCLRPSKDRPKRVKIFERYKHQYKIGDVLETADDGNVVVVSLDKKGNIDTVRCTKREVTDLGGPEVKDGEEIAIEYTPKRVALVDQEGEQVMLEGISLYEKYLRDPSLLSSAKTFINFITHNYFKDYISRERNVHPPVSIYKPIGDDGDNMVLADIFSINDEDLTSIKELIERCDDVMIRDLPLSMILKRLMEGYTMAQACKELGISTAKAKREFENIGTREILGGRSEV